MIPFALAHFFPGLGFFVLAMGYSMRTTVQLATHGRIIVQKKKKESSLWMPCASLRHPCADSYIKLAYNIFALVFQLWVEMFMYNTSIEGFDEEHVRTHNVTFWYKTGFFNVQYDLWELIYRNRPHLVMYFGFAFGAFIELLMYYGEPMPKNSDKAMMAMAFLLETFVFSNHMHGREHLDAQLHVFLAYAVYGCLIFTIIECWEETSALIQYGKAFFAFLQATWFAQTICMLYWPVDWFGAWTIFKWDIEDPRQIPNLTFIYGIHMILIMIAMLIQYIAIRRYYVYRGWAVSTLCDDSDDDDMSCNRIGANCCSRLSNTSADSRLRTKVESYCLNSDGEDTEFLLSKTVTSS